MLRSVTINSVYAIKGMSDNKEQMEDFFFSFCMHSSKVEKQGFPSSITGGKRFLGRIYIINRIVLRKNYLLD